MSAFTALTLSLLFYPAFIRRLQVFKFGQVIRKEGPEEHYKKQGTPTMGGLLIIITIFVSTVLWMDLSHRGVWTILFLMCGYGAIGFYDDFKKIKEKSSDGLGGRYKLFWQFFFASIALYVFVSGNTGFPSSGEIAFPFIAVDWFTLTLPIWLYFIFALFVIVGTSNAVNLTDGLDGLAIGPVMISAFVFLILAYIAGTSIGDLNLANYLRISHVEGASELAILCAAMIGAGFGFLWFNTYPAEIFMGDVGSLSLGGVLGLLAVLTKHEVLSALLHGVFLIEILSVIIQVFSYKTFGKRVFKMAPIHHHFEKMGWPEPKIIVRFWVISVLLALVALASLKIR